MEPSKPNVKQVALVVLAICAVVSMWTGVFDSKSKKNAVSQPQSNKANDTRISIRPQVYKTAFGIEIKNTDSFTYPDLILVINPDWKGSGYKYTGEALTPGETRRVAFGEFTDSDDERFNIFSKKLREVSVRTHINGHFASQRIGFL